MTYRGNIMQVQVTSPATTSTQAAPAKGAQRKAQRPTQAPAPVATPAIKYRMLQGFRPGSGSALFAHTAAFLELSGMDQGKRLPSKYVESIIGPAAIKHHLKATGFFEVNASGLAVSPLGIDAFALRSINPELKQAFIDILATGKTDKVVPASFTNPNGIKAI